MQHYSLNEQVARMRNFNKKLSGTGAAGNREFFLKTRELQRLLKKLRRCSDHSAYSDLVSEGNNVASNLDAVMQPEKIVQV